MDVEWSSETLQTRGGSSPVWSSEAIRVILSRLTMTRLRRMLSPRSPPGAPYPAASRTLSLRSAGGAGAGAGAGAAAPSSSSSPRLPSWRAAGLGDGSGLTAAAPPSPFAGDPGVRCAWRSGASRMVTTPAAQRSLSKHTPTTRHAKKNSTRLAQQLGETAARHRDEAQLLRPSARVRDHLADRHARGRDDRRGPLASIQRVLVVDRREQL